MEDSNVFPSTYPQNKTPCSMTTLSKVSIKDMGYAKRNKRCTPKEGVPHA